ncbi:MAG: electron transfer flavoprotein subunit alpha/FixB family protein [Candidatus Nealsonbacteria bacterium]|nr:electron transfer flavoprotein subunit alpha/FixB family protein [Candidatus Nealsonbacteria bacterium]
MREYKGIMVLGEVSEGKLNSVTAELLACARLLADSLKEKVSCVLFGSRASDFSQEVIALGADRVYLVQNSLLDNYQAETYLYALEQMVSMGLPNILLFGQTAMGRDLAPRLAFRLRVGLVTDCLELSIDSAKKNLLMTKPVYGGSARAVFASDFFPQMATVRQKAFSPLPRDEKRTGQVIECIIIDPAVLQAELKTKVIGKKIEEYSGVKLEAAKVIVCGGRGIGGPEGFKKLEELARVLKGAVGASRPPCDQGWMPASLQIGLTGKIVVPDLYIVVGVSGSSQHLAGCSGAKVIVAINSDPEANIFKEADFGIVGRWQEVLPAFIEKLKELTKDA